MAYTILIVDDNPVIRLSLRAFIERNTNCQVCGEADNGQTAIEKVKELRPDGVILDLQMPIMNGLEAAKQIKVIAPQAKIIMLTMHSSEQLRREARDAGIQEVFSKSEGIAERLLPSLRNLGCGP